VRRRSIANVSLLSLGSSQALKLPSVSLPFLHSTKCDASPTPVDCWECLNDTTVHTPRVYRKSPYKRQQSNPIEQGPSKPSEDGDEMLKWLVEHLDEKEDRAPRVYRTTPYCRRG
jgi:hypothetical protein